MMVRGQKCNQKIKPKIINGRKAYWRIVVNMGFFKKVKEKTEEVAGKTASGAEKAGHEVVELGKKGAEKVEPAVKKAGHEVVELGKKGKEKVEPAAKKAGHEVVELGKKGAEKIESAVEKTKKKI